MFHPFNFFYLNFHFFLKYWSWSVPKNQNFSFEEQLAPISISDFLSIVDMLGSLASGLPQRLRQIPHYLFLIFLPTLPTSFERCIPGRDIEITFVWHICESEEWLLLQIQSSQLHRNIMKNKPPPIKSPQLIILGLILNYMRSKGISIDIVYGFRGAQ